MWTSITWYLSLNSRQALTSPFVISKWIQQKKQLVCIEKLHILWFQKSNIFIWSLWRRSFVASGVLRHLPFESWWNQVTPSASLLPCVGLSVCSVSFASARNSEMVIYAYWNKHCLQQEHLLLCKRLSTLQGDQSCPSFLPALQDLIWSWPRNPGLKACTVLEDRPLWAFQHITVSPAKEKGLRLVLQVCNNSTLQRLKVKTKSRHVLPYITYLTQRISSLHCHVTKCSKCFMDITWKQWKCG